MNNKITVIIVAVSCVAQVQGVRWLHMWYQAKEGIVSRMYQLCRTIYSKLDERITSLNAEKFRFDITKEFEEGYLMSVIIERYRQAAEHTKFSTRMKAFKAYDIQIRLEMVQRLYIEIYRMVNMMHEIPRKYGFDIRKPKRSTVRGNPEEMIEAVKSLKSKEVNRKKKRRQQLKELKKLREEMQLAGENLTMSPRTPRNTERAWRFQEYGWEVHQDYWEDW